MTYEQGVRIASRTLAAFLLLWAVLFAINLPNEILSFANNLQGPSAGLSILSAFKASLGLRLSILDLAENILRIALWLVAAGWFYRGDPRILKFFGPANPEDAEEPPTQAIPE